MIALLHFLERVKIFPKKNKKITKNLDKINYAFFLLPKNHWKTDPFRKLSLPVKSFVLLQRYCRTRKKKPENSRKSQKIYKFSKQLAVAHTEPKNTLLKLQKLTC